MRVALVTQRFPSPEHPYITDWVQALRREGVVLTILAESLAASAGEAVVLPPVTQLNDLRRPLGAGLPNLGRWAGWMHSLRCSQPRLLSALRKGYEYAPLSKLSFDLLHFNAPQIAVRRFELGALFGCPTLVSFRGQDMSFHADRYDRLLADADHLHFISKDLLRQARARGYAKDNYTMIPPLIDVDFYRPSSAPRASQGPFTLFTAARFTWVKGLEYALQAVALLVERGIDVQYYLAGEGDLKEAVLYTIAELGLQERVHLLGWLTPAGVREWLWQSDLYLLASVSEGFNNSVLQAQACGVPVVCSDAGGLPENIEDGVTGLLCRRRDAWDMASKIERLLTDAELRLRMGSAAHQHANTQFSLKTGAGAFAVMYQQLISTTDTSI